MKDELGDDFSWDKNTDDFLDKKSGPKKVFGKDFTYKYTDPVLEFSIKEDETGRVTDVHPSPGSYIKKSFVFGAMLAGVGFAIGILTAGGGALPLVLAGIFGGSGAVLGAKADKNWGDQGKVIMPDLQDNLVRESTQNILNQLAASGLSPEQIKDQFKEQNVPENGQYNREVVGGYIGRDKRFPAFVDNELSSSDFLGRSLARADKIGFLKALEIYTEIHKTDEGRKMIEEYRKEFWEAVGMDPTNCDKPENGKSFVKEENERRNNKGPESNGPPL